MKENKKWLVLAIILIIVIPIVLNSLILCPRLFEIVGDGTDWLAFFGSYIGAILGAGVSFSIMYKNLEYYTKKDKYRRDIEWLNSFRMVCVDYLSTYNLDNVYSILDEMTFDVERAYDHCLSYQKQLINKETMMSLTVIKTKDDNLSKLFKELQDFQEYYKLRFSDITKVVFDAMHACFRDNEARYIYEVELTGEICDALKNLLATHMDPNGGMYVNVMKGWLWNWMNEMEEDCKVISEACKHYIGEKSEEIERLE